MDDFDFNDIYDISEEEIEPQLDSKRIKFDVEARIPEGFDEFLNSCRRSPMNSWSEDDLYFMQVDNDYYTGEVIEEFNDSLSRELKHSAVLRIFGLTEEGNSILAHIHGFLPYLYCLEPEGISSDELIDKLNGELRMQVRSLDFPPRLSLVHSIEYVKKTNLLFYSEEILRLVKITLVAPSLVTKTRKILEKGIVFSDGRLFETDTFEGGLPYPLRFMIDCSIPGGCWIAVNRKDCRVRESQDSFCQLEFDINYSKLRAFPAEGRFLQISPLRIMSFDIECCTAAGKGFPSADRDSVIQIASTCQNLGEEKENHGVLFCLGTCDPIAEYRVFSFEREVDLLLCFQIYVEAVDPDIFTGYNIIGFDFPFLIDRSRQLQCESQFARLGRLKSSLTRVEEAQFNSKQMGRRNTKKINTEGRIIFDMLPYILREFKFRSYTLNFVASEFLKQQKDDVHYSLIPSLHRGNSATRRRLGQYCLKDAKLPLLLMQKLHCIYNYVEMARVTGCPLNYLLTRGQMIKVVSQLHIKAKILGYCIPTKRMIPNQGLFEGATVLDPITGFYKIPIATLDFASLYPSIMQAHNLCYSTLVPPSEVERYKDLTISPNGHAFVKPTQRRGILPLVLEELLQARKKAKRAMGSAKNDLEKSVLNGRQLALKITANSVYGFTGAQVGMLPSVEISSSVTSFGRQMIEKTKQVCEELYCVKEGFQHDAVVIYGDTDSIFVKFGCETVEEAMKLGEEAAGRVSKCFLDPIKLEFEKVYFPLLLMNKKRYAGLYWTNSEAWDKLDTKGIETVRRDNCRLVQKLVDRCLREILINKSIENAISFVHSTLSDLLQNKIDISQLVITKSLTKGDSSQDYKVKLPHVELAMRMRKRNPDTAPQMGDRVPYVVIQGTRNSKLFERTEDPLYVLENNLALDGEYYVHQQIKLPLLRLFESVCEDAERVLFTGPHMRKIVSTAPVMGGLAAFVKKGRQCMGCRSILKEGVFCSHCSSEKRSEVIFQKNRDIQTKEKEYSSLWSECQRCQESFHQKILCQNVDCVIFYQRQKIKTTVKKLQDDLATLRVTNLG